MFARFTDDAHAIVVDAELEARRFDHTWIGCEHFLLALTRRTDPAADTLKAHGITASSVERAIRDLLPVVVTDSAALASIGIDLDRVRAYAEASFGPGALDRFTKTKSQSRRHRRRSNRCRDVSTRRFFTTGAPLSFTPRAKQCLEIAATSAGSGPVRPIHLAVAVMSRSDTTAGEILNHLNTDIGRMRAALAASSTGNPE
jgi:ATP-dependent Clp protease ATP-binding subunit ClpA